MKPIALTLALLIPLVAVAQDAPADTAPITDNDADFQYNLGQEYAQRRDYPAAREWLGKAAAQNNADAQTALGILDYYGIAPGKERDAGKWFAKAAKQNHPVALDWQGVLAADNQNPGRAREKYNRAAALGSTTAMRHLGLAQLKNKKYDEGRVWLEKAADGQPPDAAAMRHLALDIYQAGHGAEANEQHALDWLQRASEAGDSTAGLLLGRAYRLGERGVSADEKQACAYYAKSAGQHGGLPAALILKDLQNQKKCADIAPVALPDDYQNRDYRAQENAHAALLALDAAPKAPPPPSPAPVASITHASGTTDTPPPP